MTNNDSTEDTTSFPLKFVDKKEHIHILRNNYHIGTKGAAYNS